jgi:hypothetical protein
MITVDDEVWVTAEEAITHLCPAPGPVDITPTMIRNWVRRRGIRKARIGRNVLYPLNELENAELAAAAAGTGRPRSVSLDEVDQ